MTPFALPSTLPPPARPTLAAAIPFMAVALLGLGSVLLPPYADGSLALIVWSVLGFLAVLGFLFVSVRRTTRTWVDPMPAFLFFGVLALARHASGGSEAGLAPLVALPILWLAITGTRRDVAIAAVLTAAMFISPDGPGRCAGLPARATGAAPCCGPRSQPWWPPSSSAWLRSSRWRPSWPKMQAPRRKASCAVPVSAA